MDPCSPTSLPEGDGTFAALYESDGNHPSYAGQYLQSLIIASSMTGAPPPALLLLFGHAAEGLRAPRQSAATSERMGVGG